MWDERHVEVQGPLTRRTAIAATAKGRRQCFAQRGKQKGCAVMIEIDPIDASDKRLGFNTFDDLRWDLPVAVGIMLGAFTAGLNIYFVLRAISGTLSL